MNRFPGDLSTHCSSIGDPVKHYCRNAVGVVKSYYFDEGRLHYVVEWLSEGIAPNVPADAGVGLPSEMHLLALA